MRQPTAVTEQVREWDEHDRPAFYADASGKMVKPDDYAERRDELKRHLESLQPMLFKRK